MEKIRVKFYSSTDLSCGINLTRSADVLEKFETINTYNDINDILEFYNINKYFDKGLKLPSWDLNVTSAFSAKVEQFPSIIGKYLEALTAGEIRALIRTIDMRYRDDVWEIVEKYNVYKKITPSEFTEILAEDTFQMKYVLRHPKTVKRFKEEIRAHLICTPGYAELLIANYLETHDERWHSLYFQNCLEANDKETMVLQYVNSQEPNLNYIELISKSQCSPDLPLSDSIILAAKKRYCIEVDKLFGDKGGIDCTVQVTFSDDQNELKIEENRGLGITASYSLAWIKENSDYPTLLNNFIYLFNYVDQMFRSQFVHNERYLGVFEKYIGVKGRRDYITGIGCNQLERLNTLQIMGYDQELKRQNIDLVSIYKWFFETYLLQEFGISNFVFNTPSEGTTFFEKCRFVSSEIDSILKQFKLYTMNGEIDHELLQISSNHLLFREVPSMIKDKYLYPTGDKFQRATFLLFSDQSLLSYVERAGGDYTSFYDLIRNEKIKPEDYTVQKSDLDWLMSLGYIDLDTAGNLEISSNEVIILKDLWFNSVSCPSYLSNFSSIISNMVAEGEAYFESTLFSKPEQDYLNYILNRSEFSNGLDLRNKYSHGTHPTASDEAAHRQNYYIFLKIITLIIIKINEEFCLKKSRIQP